MILVIFIAGCLVGTDTGLHLRRLIDQTRARGDHWFPHLAAFAPLVTGRSHSRSYSRFPPDGPSLPTSFPERPLLTLTMRLQWEGLPAVRACRVDSIVVRQEQELAGQIPLFGNPFPLGVALISASKNAWIYRLKAKRGAFLALTPRLRRGGRFGLRRYRSDLIGGKGGTRTLDPGIMSGNFGLFRDTKPLNDLGQEWPESSKQQGF